ncbi:hypothetical protein [Roseovarius sp.]|uniref:hypothetical protein n=1 Tax=Roseovarius sp. TaxID=1486281 RepID=UPI003A97A09E
MSNSYRNGAFALGLVVGGGLTLNLLLWLDYRARNEIESESRTSQDTKYSEIGNYWDGLVGTFISPSDTLAQWIMAFFTIAATIVLVFTLRSANKTNIAAVESSKAALEANKIMQAEQRPWVTINFKGNYRIHRGKVNAWIKCEPKNVGKSPALDCSLLVSTSDCSAEIYNIRDAIIAGGDLSRWKNNGRIIFPGSSVYGSPRSSFGSAGNSVAFPLNDTPPDNLLDVCCLAIYRSTDDGDWLYTIQNVSVLTVDGDNQIPLNCNSADEVFFHFSEYRNVEVK